MLGFRFWDVVEDKEFGYLLQSPFKKSLWHPEHSCLVDEKQELKNATGGYLLDNKIVDYSCALQFPNDTLDLTNNEVIVPEIGWSAYFDVVDLLQNDVVQEFATILGAVEGYGDYVSYGEYFHVKEMKVASFLYDPAWDKIRIYDITGEQVSYENTWDVLVELSKTYGVMIATRDLDDSTSRRVWPDENN